MKFWQLTSIFRDEEELLIDILAEEKWSEYFINYKNLDELCKTQNRRILDAEIDNSLLEEVCARTKKVLYYSTSQKTLYSYQSGFADRQISLLQAVKSYSHDSIEEAYEKTEATIS